MTDFPKLKPFSVEELDELLKAVKKEIKKENQDGFSIDMPVMKVSLEKKDFEEAQWDSFKAAAKNDDYPEVLQDYVKDVLFKNYDNFSDKRDDLLSCFWDTAFSEKLDKKFGVHSYSLEFNVGVESWEKFGKSILLTIQPSVSFDF